MPTMLLHPKRAVLSLAQTRWKAIPGNCSQVRAIRSSPPIDAEEVEFSGNDVRRLSFYFVESHALTSFLRTILFYLFFAQSPLFEIQSPIWLHLALKRIRQMPDRRMPQAHH